MIYANDILFPVLCPIQFEEPREDLFYPYQNRFLPKIVDEVKMQFRISKEIFDSLTVTATLSLRDSVTGATGFNYTGAWDYTRHYVGGECVKYETRFYIWTNSISASGEIPALGGGWSILNETVYEYIEYSDPVNLDMKVTNKANKVTTHPFTARKLSAEFYYATISFPVVGNDYVIFSIEYDGTLVADSVIYELNPTYSDDLKRITYSHSHNDYETIFADQEIFTFDLYLPCGFDPDDSESSFEAQDFEEQNLNNQTLFGVPVLKEKLKTDNQGIPIWMAHKLNSIMLLDNVTIDSVRYMRSTGAKVELVEKCNKGLGIYAIGVQRNNLYAQSPDSANSVFNYELSFNVR